MFRGTGTALITPFRNGAVDFDALGELLNFQVENGVDALIVLGTTGEAATLTPAERDEVISFALRTVDGRIPVIIGTGTNNTATTVDLSRRAEELGADGALVVTPFYNKPNQEGLYRHFRTVAESVRIPVILYNVPGRTGVNLAPETALRLARIENIVGVKEASGNQYQCDSLIRSLRVVRPDFRVWSGNDDQAFHLVCCGGDGVISVLSNVLPAQTVAMIDAALGGDVAAARRLHLRLLPLMKDLFNESNPIPVKFAAGELGLCRDELRLPLVPAGERTRELVRADLLELGALEAE
ncbi:MULTISPECIES: 4-hydroxy-tetrahydrodipicolinate synthase [unclassified Pyramidobacter]|uniref:4-hydroxy-tetrahydrodipicolinate synthase n=1 Tax=unclassified Pyramidobacter TaxID=2632171 RepID=UPI00098EA85F|nr:MULTISPECIES: 4-hydroxy-tetrahydrodipicolinate synthase [unclassified Pyramidobacter]OON88619.1 4-hydroxy-tetrahydrodipicolinate synthase [Pyramidobacter sp. C12-8]RKJ78700.1 4-hydroxy-tetrahydrodipicolinate synthase [Pyramidobacter sp. CG50-2]